MCIAPSGGLKGKMALGDAHPYLALFYLVLILTKRKAPPIFRGGVILAATYCRQD